MEGVQEAGSGSQGLGAVIQVGWQIHGQLVDYFRGWRRYRLLSNRQRQDLAQMGCRTSPGPWGGLGAAHWIQEGPLALGAFCR